MIMNVGLPSCFSNTSLVLLPNISANVKNGLTLRSVGNYGNKAGKAASLVEQRCRRKVKVFFPLFFIIYFISLVAFFFFV